MRAERQGVNVGKTLDWQAARRKGAALRDQPATTLEKTADESRKTPRRLRLSRTIATPWLVINR
jgi:hypothetical protein